MLGRIFLGQYEVLSPLGEGSMGRVYLARQRTTGRQVVVKVMKPQVTSQPRFRELFRREMVFMARFNHPYAVQLLAASETDPQGPCIVMEYVRGVDLDRLRSRQHRLEPVRVGRLLGQLCEVLQAAHVQGIVHRDLKPANLMIVNADTALERIKVMDFGLAKMAADPQQALNGPTDRGVVKITGTPEYVCPEQVRGEPMDARGDLYSVGVILYELLTGRLPFYHRTIEETLAAHVHEQPPPFSAAGSAGRVSPAVEAVVQSCLAKNPAERPANAWELAQRFERALGQKVLDPIQPVPIGGAVPPQPSNAAIAGAIPSNSRPQLTTRSLSVPTPVARPLPTSLDSAARAEPAASTMSASAVKQAVAGLRGNAAAAPSTATMSASAVQQAAASLRANSPPASITSAPAPAAHSGAPDEVQYRLEAAMLLPETLDRLKRFAEGLGGKVVELSPDLIRVLLGKDCRAFQSPPSAGSPTGSLYGPSAAGGPLPALTEMELHIARKNPRQHNLQVITLQLRPVGNGDAPLPPAWKACCDRIHGELTTALR